MLLPRSLPLLLLLPALGGCGFLFGDQGTFRDKSEDYKRAPETPMLQVPADKKHEQASCKV